MNIRLVVIDLDGTLLNSQHEISERTEKAIKAVLDKGIPVVLATGKTRAAGKPIIERFNLTSPGIYLQGLAVYNGDGTIRHQQALDPAIARRAITFAEDRGFLMAAYCGTRILLRSHSLIAEELPRYHEPMPEIVGPLQNLLDEMPVNKLIAAGDPRRIKALRWQLDMQFNGSIKLTQALDTMLEILPPGTSKGAALRQLLKDMNIAAHEVLAIGDAENDIEMIQLAGIGVAVGNADAKTQAAADYVVASNDADGVGEALEQFVLGIEKPESTGETASPAESLAAPASTPRKEVKAE